MPRATKTADNNAANETAVENTATTDVNAATDDATANADTALNAAGNAVENAGNAVDNAATPSRTRRERTVSFALRSERMERAVLRGRPFFYVGRSGSFERR